MFNKTAFSAKHIQSVTLYLGLLFISGPGFALNIFACEPEWQALAHEIAGPDVEVYVATSAQQDPHHVQPRPSLISAVRRADVVFCTGAGLEAGWLPVLLSKGSNPRVQRAPGLFLAAEQVTLLEKPIVLDRADGDVHASGNPHVHLDPRRMLIIAQALSARLAEIDPNNATLYQNRLASFSQRWESNIETWQSQARTLKGATVIVHHRSWSYLLDWLALEQVGELEPKPGIPPTPTHLAKLINVAETQRPYAIIYTNYNGDKAANWLAERSSVCALALPFTVETTNSNAASFDINKHPLDELFNTIISKLLAERGACTHD
ncbi:MAG: zinc ABC transporter substrate-binding protein [Gammaproteobacteria bacterium]|jgi:zinc/manganese transport system substrate-binding protein|nr:zinc ABC transporter substrate-binding protein [Gammaproteobacteria bacterium]MBQ0775095.1 zinc ABC transporter substrate-binding protein [Gammaproteobacteria bacterium]|tara:strand:+ start:91848 stop:92810 length:963 start_codon:yes stop_codon:yes gene_type:complete